MTLQIERIKKPEFSIIGKQGSTSDGENFIQDLWDEANSNFDQVQPLAKRKADGQLAGIWGAMSDMSGSFAPWEDGFTRGLYLAGVECRDEAEPPEGWTKWTVPGFEYLKVKADGDIFQGVLRYIEENGMELVGAVHDFTDPGTGEGYMMFPVGRE